MDAATSRGLAEAEELELVTTGRSTGQPHAVRLHFAYDGGVIWLRAGERRPDPNATGVRRGAAESRKADWLRNLERDPRCRVRVGGGEMDARYEPTADAAADLQRAVALMREKYGPDWVQDWYVERGRAVVKLRLLPTAPFSEGSRMVT